MTEEDDAGATYRLTMVSEPAEDVTVELSGLAGSDVIAMPASVTFTPDDWDEPKTIRLTAAGDADRMDDRVTIEHSAVEPVRGLYVGDDIDSVRATVLDNDVPVRVSFEQVSYTVAESDDALTTDVQEDRVTIRVLLDTAPRRTVTVPIIPMLRGGATGDDYTGVPPDVTFASDETEQTFTFIAAHDTDDDDEDYVLLTFGTLPEAVSEGAENRATVSITDDDDPEVTVRFELSTYSVQEDDDTSTTNVQENMAAVKVLLSEDPERTFTIDIVETAQGGATSADYSCPRPP